MSESKDEQELLLFTTTHLDKSVEELDATTRSRLGHARREAISGNSHSRQWAWPMWGFASTSVVVLSTILWFQNPMNSSPPLVPEDLELLANSDSLEFYEDLEFYDWLTEYEQAS